MKLKILSLLLTLLLSTYTNSIEVTTGNLLPNAGDGVDWNSSSTDMINDGGSGFVTNGQSFNGFTVTCPTGQANCGYKYDVGGDFEVTGTATVSADDIKLYSNSITQSMLDTGITLNSNVDVANCESVEGNCESKTGSNDTHTTIMVLKDSDGNILSSVSQTRNEITGFKGNCNGYPGSNSSGITAACGQYTDTLIHNDVGANNVDWSWSGTDSHGSSTSRGGPNLLGTSLYMTYSTDEYNPIDDDAQDAIDEIENNIPDLPDFEEEFTFEEIDFNDDFYFPEEIDMPEEFEIIEMPDDMEEAFSIVAEEMPGEFEEMEMEEEFVEMEEQPEMETMEEQPEEMEIAENKEMKEPEPTEEEMTEPEEEVTNDELTEEDNSTMENESEEKESVSEAAENESEEDGPSEKKAEDTAVNDTNETKIADKKVNKSVNIDEIKVDEVKVDVKEVTLFSEQDSLDSYSTMAFYGEENLDYEVNNDFFIQTNLIGYTKQIYENVSLTVYIENDPVEIQRKKLEELSIQKAGIMLELKLLKQ